MNMKRKLFNPVALVCCLLFVIAVLADPNGKWVGVIQTPDGNTIDVGYNFKVDGAKLTGTAQSPAGEVSIDNGKVDGDKFSFTVNVSGTEYPHTGKFYADSCALDVDFGAAKVHTILKRPAK
jgi:hypothetical protein